jgi:integrase
MIRLASLYCDERHVTAQYRTDLKRVAQSMHAAGVTPSTLEDSIFNRWLASLNQAPTTRSNYRRMGLTLWRFACDLKLAEHYPRRVVRVKARPKAPVAWTMKDMESLLAAAARQTYLFKRSKCPAAVFFEAWVRAGYETGLRFSDLLSLQCHQLREDRLYVAQNKTGVPVPKQLTQECVSALRRMETLGDRKTFFRWAIAKKQLRAHFKKVCAAAGADGTSKWLRRTGATHCEIKQPGTAGRFLGQLSPGLAYRFYVDRSQLNEECPTPPPIQNRTSGQCAASASASDGQPRRPARA